MPDLDPVSVELGRAIRSLRGALGISQEELGTGAGGVQTAMISNYERGQKLPRRGTLERIIAGFRRHSASEERIEELWTIWRKSSGGVSAASSPSTVDAALTPPNLGTSLAVLVPAAEGGWWFRVPAQVPMDTVQDWVRRAQFYATQGGSD